MSVPLTVVITSYNREQWIGASIASVLANDLEDYSILVVDDASTDGTAEVAREYALRDPRVKVVVNSKNLGDYGNRNHAIELVETPYLKFHDSDDLMYPHCLRTMMSMLLEAPEAGFALSSSRSWPGGPCPMLLSPRLCYLREYLGQGMFNGGPATALFRTEVLRRLGGFPSRGAASDYCFWLKACAEVSVLLVPADLFWYRVHPGQELQSSRAAEDYASAQGEAWRALVSETCPLSGDELASAKRSCTYRLLRLTWRDLKKGRWSHVRLRLRSAGIRWMDWLQYPPARAGDFWAGTPVKSDGTVRAPASVATNDGGRPQTADASLGCSTTTPSS